MRGIEFLIVFSVAALHFAVMPWHVRANKFMENAHTFQFQFKQRRFIITSRRIGNTILFVRIAKTVCQLLNTNRVSHS